jgi:hypothetical protein
MKLHNEEPHNLYSSSIVITVITFKDEFGRTCSMHGGDERWIHHSVGNLQRNMPYGRRDLERGLILKCKRNKIQRWGGGLESNVRIL